MSYLTPLEALEAAIAPQERLVVLIVKVGETTQGACSLREVAPDRREHRALPGRLFQRD